MHFSRRFGSSPQCAVSRDGLYIANLSATAVVVRSTETLQIQSTVKIPSEISGSVLSLVWAPSSTKILVSSADQIHVMSVSGPPFRGTIRYPATGSGKPSYTCFGADDSELLVFASFGLKLLVYDLSTSKAIEIASPKFHLASSAARGFSIRSKTAHMALLTRVGGRDTVSIHNPKSRQVQRSWHPDTVDAQAVSWSPDGQWLILWESSAYGRRLLLYTPDGQLFRTIGAPKNADDDQDTLKPGLKLCQFSPDSQLCVLCDHSRGVAVLNTAAWRGDLTLTHPRAITPSDNLQVWQEQLKDASSVMNQRSFVRATQTISPPVPSGDTRSATETKTGCSTASFDSSSTLLATRLEEAPSTIWIWDLATAELRAVLMFHSSADFAWHPSIRELLLVVCHDEGHTAVPFVWDPLSNGPTCIPVIERLSQSGGKVQATWVAWNHELPALLLSDPHSYFVVSPSDTEHGPAFWKEDIESDSSISFSDHGLSYLGRDATASGSLIGDDTYPLEDTFSFKYGRDQ